MKAIPLKQYLNLDPIRKRAECDNILKKAPEFQFAALGVGNDLLPTVFHKRTKLRFKLVFSCSFSMGLSDEEEKAARRIFDPPPLTISELRPVQIIDIDAFLVTSTPIIWADYVALSSEKIISDDRFSYLRDTRMLGFPACVSHADATKFAKSLDCRLPKEAEWECACRAMTKSLFAFGNEIPSYDDLCGWLANDFSGDRAVSRWNEEWELTKLDIPCNAFGLYGLYTGEWCKEEWRPTLAPSAPPIENEHVVRGGGSLFWPWQDREWVWCVSAMRMPSSATFDGTCGFRLVYPL